jgi:large subunit ribosomal protein L21
MYAVFVANGKQYRASKGDVLKIELMDAAAGTAVAFDQVMLVSDGDKINVGAPTVAGAKVEATIKSHGRADKIHIVKFRRRKHHRKQMGHRQHYTEVEITGIVG